MISRRRWLQLLGLSGFGSAFASVGLHARTKLLPQTKPPLVFGELASLPAFEEIPSDKSGITWKHVAGLSPEMYMPETVGPGCAFLDYDNDGWMDIYLVRSEERRVGKECNTR